MNLVAISGSLRPESLNTMLLHSLREFLPTGTSYTVINSLAELPFYDQSLESEPPSSVLALRSQAEQADAVIIASPEYNYSYTGLLKNALEWLSRPVGSGALEHKTVALLGASPGIYGTIRSQAHLRQVLHGTNSLVLRRPEIYINEAPKKFDQAGKLIDPIARSLVEQMITNLHSHLDENFEAA
jgi:chromate reductase